MWTGKYELVIVWETGEDLPQVFEYDDREQAERAGAVMAMVHGAQIAYWCVRKQYA